MKLKILTVSALAVLVSLLFFSSQVSGAIIIQPEENCFDSDGGRDYFTRGTVTITCPQRNQETHTDYCSGNYLYEYYCSGDSYQSELHYCSHGCSSGACISQPTCSDSDSGLDYYTRGTVTSDGQTYTDYCTYSTQLMEYYCSHNQMQGTTYNCPNQCSNGRCIQQQCTPKYLNQYRCSGDWRQKRYQKSDCSTEWRNWEHCSYGCSSGQCISPPTCSDTDSGLDYDTKGTVTRDGQTHTDYCTSSVQMVEYYCSGNQVHSQTHTCSYRCSDGRCIQPQCEEKYLDNYRCSGDWRQKQYQKGDCSTEWRNWEFCTFGCSGGNCTPPPVVGCTIDVSHLDVVNNKLKAKVKNTGTQAQLINYTLTVTSADDDPVATGSFTLNASQRKTVENNYTFSPGTYNILFQAESDCGASDSASMTHRVLEPFTCTGPNGREGQTRCDTNKRKYYICRATDWKLVAENSGDYCYYCSHCGDGVKNCGETVSSCYQDATCTQKYLDHYQCRGSWLQKKLQHRDCSTQWKDWKYCQYGCSGDQCKQPCREGYIDSYRCSGDWSQRVYRYRDCSTQWKDWEYCTLGCSSGHCLKRCGVSIIGVDYSNNVPAGETTNFEVTVKNTGEKREAIDLTFSVDGVQKQSYSKSIHTGDKFSHTFEYFLSGGQHRVSVFADADCGDSDAVSRTITAYPEETPVVQPPEEPQPEPEILETDVFFHPRYLDIQFGKSEVLYADIQTNQSQTFRLSVSGIGDGWVDYPETIQVEDKKRVFVYVTPKKPGSFHFDLTVEPEKEDSTFTETINVYVASPYTLAARLDFLSVFTGNLFKFFFNIWTWIGLLLLVLILVILTGSRRLTFKC